MANKQKIMSTDYDVVVAETQDKRTVATTCTIGVNNNSRREEEDDDEARRPPSPSLRGGVGLAAEKKKAFEPTSAIMQVEDDQQLPEKSSNTTKKKKKKGRRDRRRDGRNKQMKRPRSSSLEQGEQFAVDNDEGPPALALQVRVVPLELEKGKPACYSSSSSSDLNVANQRWVRLIEPYPYTFKSFAKQRWVGRSILDVYASEFGSYPQSYYRAAIEQGRILVNDNQRVDPSYLIKATDVLQHTVHRHEPAVTVSQPSPPYVIIVAETASVLVVDKPTCLPIHPCGGYHCNSLMPMLTSCFNNKKLYTIHRLDRLTSGLVVLAKSSQVAADWAQAIQARDCQKLYLARVRGQFPLNLLLTGTASTSTPNAIKLPRLGGVAGGADMDESNSKKDDCGRTRLPVNGEWKLQHQQEPSPDDDLSIRRRRNAHGWWITNAARGDALVDDVSLEQILSKAATGAERQQQRHSVLDAWLEALATKAEASDSSTAAERAATSDHGEGGDDFYWLHLACPTRVVEPKNGVCSSGTFDDLPDSRYLATVKACHTSFAVLSYHADSDSTLVLCRPHTGRTHQIRIHLQYLGHSIANDPNYGGDMWYHNPQGLEACRQAQALLNAEDENSNGDRDGGGSSTPPHYSSLVTSDEPATEGEVQRCTPRRGDEEPLEEFLRRTCVWCARNRSGREDRAALELLVRSPGIWLHALQYSVVLNSKTVVFRTDLPDWASI